MATETDLGQYQPIVDILNKATSLSLSPEELEDLNSSGPITAGADKSLADIMSELSAATSSPVGAISTNKTAPLPQNVTILPPYDTEAVTKNYNHLVELSSVIAMYCSLWNAAAREARGHPDPYNITIASEAAQAFADMASSAYTVMTGPLAGILNFSSGVQTTFSKSMSKTTVHLEWLNEIFQGFSLTKPALMQLDSILTKFIASLGTINVETNKSNNTVDQTLFINQVIRLNVSGDDGNPVFVYQPRTRVVYLHIDGSSWHWATNKAEHTEMSFNMRYVVVDCDLNVTKYLATKPTLESVFTQLSGQSLADFGKKINPPPVPSDKK